MIEPPSFGQSKPDPQGIGGWLILPLIGLVVAPIMLGKSLMVDLLPIFVSGTWANLTDPESPVYSAYWAPYLLLSTFLAVVLLPAAIVLLVLFLIRHRKLPFWISVFYGATALAALFEFASLRHLFAVLPEIADAEISLETWRDLIRGLTSVAIWVPYFQRSERVKNTFVR